MPEDGERKTKRGGARAGAGRKAGWSERGEGGGRPKGIKVHYKTLSISLKEEEAEKLRGLADASGKSLSRFIYESIVKMD